MNSIQQDNSAESYEDGDELSLETKDPQAV